jgi:hypothetical protein
MIGAIQCKLLAASHGRRSAGSQGAVVGEVVVDVRFHPNGLVNTINHRPENLSPQGWFDRLCHADPKAYRALSGGRGTFLFSHNEFDAILARAVTG